MRVLSYVVHVHTLPLIWNQYKLHISIAYIICCCMFVVVLTNTHTMLRTYRNTRTGVERTEEYTPVRLKGFNKAYKDSQGRYYVVGLLGMFYLHPANYELIEY